MQDKVSIWSYLLNSFEMANILSLQTLEPRLFSTETATMQEIKFN